MPQALVTERLTADQAQMVADNIGLVHWWVARNCPASNGAYSEDDAIQDGTLGLIRAAQLFDPAKGFKFSTYAMTWIRQSISRGRGRVEGRSYRAAQAANEAGNFVHPLSLEYDTSYENDPHSLVAVLPADGPPIDNLAVGAVMSDEITARAESLCQNGMDREVVASWSGTDTYTSIAERHGVSREYVRRRACRIREHLADWLEGPAA